MALPEGVSQWEIDSLVEDQDDLSMLCVKCEHFLDDHDCEGCRVCDCDYALTDEGEE